MSAPGSFTLSPPVMSFGPALGPAAGPGAAPALGPAGRLGPAPAPAACSTGGRTCTSLYSRASLDASLTFVARSGSSESPRENSPPYVTRVRFALRRTRSASGGSGVVSPAGAVGGAGGATSVDMDAGWSKVQSSSMFVETIDKLGGKLGVTEALSTLAFFTINPSLNDNNRQQPAMVVVDRIHRRCTSSSQLRLWRLHAHSQCPRHDTPTHQSCFVAASTTLKTGLPGP